MKLQKNKDNHRNLIKKIPKEKLYEEIKLLCAYVNYSLPEDVLKGLKKAFDEETSIRAKNLLKQILENNYIATKENLPLCQDTGILNFFVKIGRKIYIDYDIREFINEASREAYKEAGFRKSIIQDPLLRHNYDYIPSVVYLEYSDDDFLEIQVLVRGGGSENSSKFISFVPSVDYEKLKKLIVEDVLELVPYSCPPVVVGIGIGGSFEYACYLSKKALLREIGTVNTSSFYSNLEKELLETINNSWIGVQGIGGKTTSLAVHIEKFPTHIASLPVAITLQCHCLRRKKLIF